jgi:hypothetical protein
VCVAQEILGSLPLLSGSAVPYLLGFSFGNLGLAARLRRPTHAAKNKGIKRDYSSKLKVISTFLKIKLLKKIFQI